MRRDPIRMCPYDPDWPSTFERERVRLAPILQPYLVEPLEHIGSTSVPGLVAKPIIDMVAVVEDISPVIVEAGPLRRIGWVLAPEPADEIERRLSFCTPSKELRTITSTSWRSRSQGGEVGLRFMTTCARTPMSLGSTANQRRIYP